MSFAPTFEITRILRDSSAIFVKDTTISGGTTGYGSTNAPANVAAITALLLEIIPYNDVETVAVLADGYTLATFTTELKYTYDIPDGVVITRLSYGELKTIGVTVVSGRLSLTITNAVNVFAGVDYISLDGTTLIAVSNISGNTVTLASALPGSATSLTQIYRFYSSELRSLILYKGDKYIVREIDKISMYDSNWDMRKAMLKVILKEKAQSEYALGNYAKANEAALLISGTTPVYTSTPICE